VAGERSLHGHVGGFLVPDFAHHDDVRVLPHQRAQAVGKAKIDAVLHLHLFSVGSTISIGSSTVLTLTSSVASCFSVEYSVVVLARARGSRHQHDARGPVNQVFQTRDSSGVKRVRRTAYDNLRVEIRITSFSPNAVGRSTNGSRPRGRHSGHS